MEQVHEGDVFAVLPTLPERSVHTCVTSPPYWGLRDYGVEGQLGLEPLHDCAGWATGKPCGVCYICRMVEVFRLVKRVLRDDGTAWVNMGDTYAGSSQSGSDTPRVGGGEKRLHELHKSQAHVRAITPGLKSKDLCMIPARLALALQADGWYLRSDIIWHKPNPMPESVTDRPTKSHEYIFLLAKQERYYYDAAAVMEENSDGPFWKTHPHGQRSIARTNRLNGQQFGVAPNTYMKELAPGSGRNRRSVWTVTTKPFSGAHFATFPPDLIEPCILAGAPEKCCPKCGAPYERVVERSGGSIGKGWTTHTDDLTMGMNQVGGHIGGRRDADGKPYTRTTRGFTPGCSCDAGKPVGGVVLDPFGGSGTTALVARKHGRGFVLVEKNPEYATMIRARLNGTFEQLEAQKAGKPYMNSLFGEEVA